MSPESFFSVDGAAGRGAKEKGEGAGVVLGASAAAGVGAGEGAPKLNAGLEASAAVVTAGASETEAG